MNLNFKRVSSPLLRNWHITITAICIFLVCGFVYSDYGISVDEQVSRMNGLVNSKYILNGLGISVNSITVYKDIPELHDYFDKDYGAFFEMLTVVFELAFGLSEFEEVFKMRHLLTGLLFGLSAILFGALIQMKTKSKWMFLVAVIVYFLSPRIFGHGFFNNKDIVGLSFITIAVFWMYRYARSQSYIDLIVFSIFTGLAINSRLIAGLIPLIAVIGEFKYRTFTSSRHAGQLLTFVLITGGIYFIVTPFIWENPAGNFLEALSNMSKFRWNGWVFFSGIWQPVRDLPWYYLPSWILMTESWFVLLGIIILGLGAIHHLTSKMRLKIDFMNFFMLCLLVVPLFLVLGLGSTVYDGWRQFYFLHLPLAFFSSQGWWIASRFLSVKVGNVGIAISVFAMVVISVRTIISMHPYQYGYFNALAGEAPETRYEVDYWCVSYLDALRKLESETKSNKEPLKLFLNGSPLAKKMLADGGAAIDLVPLDSCDFAISSNRTPINMNSDFNVISEIKRCGVVINRTYARR